MNQIYQVYPRVPTAGLEDLLNTMAGKDYWPVNITAMLDGVLVVFMYGGFDEAVADTMTEPTTQVIGADLIAPTTRVG